MRGVGTTIRAVCNDCGQVELPASQVHLTICTNRSALNTYAFTCPDCGLPHTVSAPPHVTRALMSGQVPTTTWSIPAEAFEPHNGPPISYDDILDLQLELSSSSPAPEFEPPGDVVDSGA